MRLSATILALTLPATLAFSAPAGAAESAARILLDRTAVIDLCTDYASARDAADADALRALLTPMVEMVVAGHPMPPATAAEEAEYRRRDVVGINERSGVPTTKFGVLRHVITNVDVVLRGDAATVTCHEITTGYD